MYVDFGPSHSYWSFLEIIVVYCHNVQSTQLYRMSVCCNKFFLKLELRGELIVYQDECKSIQVVCKS